MRDNKTLPSKRFGGWEMRRNGLQQHGISASEFIERTMDGWGVREKVSKAEAKVILDRAIQAECWYSLDGKYKVVKQVLHMGDGFCHNENFDGTIWLSVRIIGPSGDTHLRDWRDFQSIKNDICGDDRCAIEMYPEEYRVVDLDNVFHLWVLPEDVHIPIGWVKRDVAYDQGSDQRAENE